MNEVTKLYENAGIEHEGLEWVCQNPDHCTYQNLSIIPENCSGCEYFKKERIYPPFTAEKQIELIKWLGELQIDTREGYWHLAKFGRTTKTVYADNCNLEEALSEIVNHLWQDLTAEKRKQIKEILE